MLNVLYSVVIYSDCVLDTAVIMVWYCSPYQKVIYKPRRKHYLEVCALEVCFKRDVLNKSMFTLV